VLLHGVEGVQQGWRLALHLLRFATLTDQLIDCGHDCLQVKYPLLLFTYFFSLREAIEVHDGLAEVQNRIARAVICCLMLNGQRKMIVPSAANSVKSQFEPKPRLP
jgi:hypothetical protein